MHRCEHAVDSARSPALLLAGVAVGALATGVSVAGLAGRLDARSLATAAAAAVALTVLAWRHERWAPPPGGPLLALLLPLVPVLVAAAFVPPHTWDEVAYSVALPRAFAAARRFFYDADYGPYSAFPGNYEALTTAALLAFRGAAAVKLLNVAMAVGLALVAGELLVELGGRRAFAVLAALLVLTAPAVVTWVTVAKNDVANAFFQSLAALACVRWLRRPEGWRMVVVAGGLLGVAMGTKYSSLQFAACLGPSLAVVAARLPLGAGAVARRLAALAACAGLAAAPWYLRNLVELGNPVFPFLTGLLGARGGFGPAQALITREMFEELSGYGPRTGTPAGFAAALVAGFGWLPVLLALPGLAGVAARARSRAAGFLGALLLSLGAVTLLFGYWEARYVLTLLVLAAAFAAWLLDAAAEAALARVADARAGAWSAAALAAGLCAAGVAREVAGPGEEVSRWRVRTARQFEAGTVHFWDVAEWINGHLGPEDRIGVGVNVQPFLYVDRPWVHLHPMSEKGDLQAAVTADDFFRRFRALGLTALAFRRWNPDADGYPAARTPRLHAFLERLYAAVDTLERRGDLERLATVNGVVMYRMAGPGAPAGAAGEERAP